MSKKMEVPVDLRLDENEEWVISTKKPPRLVQRGVTVKQARIRLSRLLAERHGVEVELLEDLELAKPLREEVDEYQRELAQYEELGARLAAKRIPLARKLIIDGRLLQSQVAELLHISGTWLGQELRRSLQAGKNRAEEPKGAARRPVRKRSGAK